MKKRNLKLISLLAFGATVLSGCRFVYHYVIPDFPYSDSGSGGSGGGDGGGTSADNGFEDTGIEDAGTYSIKIWCDERISTQIKTQVSAFSKHFGSKYTINLAVKEVSESIAASQMTDDVTNGADIFVFPQDQLSKLKTAGALAAITKDLKKAVVNETETEGVNAASINGTMYAFPFTSDNGYFLFYDKRVISDEQAKSIEGIVEAAKAAKMAINYPIFANGFYTASYFMATGCESNWVINKANKFVDYKDNYNSEDGLKAARALKYLKAQYIGKKPLFAGSNDPSKFNRGENGICACVTGMWDYQTAAGILGENLGCAEMPTFTLDGKKYHISSFSGYKLIGVKPQEDAKKVSVCKRIARYLSSETCQLARFNLVEWGPSNINALANNNVAIHKGLSALRAQKPYSKPQVQCPASWFGSVSSLANQIAQDSTDDELRGLLQDYQDNLDVLLAD